LSQPLRLNESKSTQQSRDIAQAASTDQQCSHEHPNNSSVLRKLTHYERHSTAAHGADKGKGRLPLFTECFDAGMGHLIQGIAIRGWMGICMTSFLGPRNQSIKESTVVFVL
jgi:hypothetical protein